MTKLQFPAPPKGKQWHNPENYSPEQIEIDKGWRLTLVGEEKGRDWEIETDSSGNTEESCDWQLSDYNAFDKNWTYRTKAPLPVETPELDSIQVQFEEWAESLGWGVDFSKDKYGDYSSDETSLAWLAWKTAQTPVSVNEPAIKPASTWPSEDNVITMRIINSTDDENSHYYTVQINEWGCVQLNSFAFEGHELLESFTLSPKDSLLVSESLRWIAEEEIKKGAF